MAIQDHIHLSSTVGGAPEFSPDMKWKVRVDGWMPTPEIISNHRRTLGGKLKKYVLSDVGGDPIQFMNFRYVVKVDDYDGFTLEQRYDALLAMQGKSVMLVDVRHVDDDQNHSGHVRTMYCSAVVDITPINPQQIPLYFGIELVDDDTVT